MMSTHNPEVVPARIKPEYPGTIEAPKKSPEMPPLTPGEQQLLEAITFPEDLLEKWHKEFDTAIQEELATCIDPADKVLISLAASSLEWQWFGGVGVPLPDGLVIEGPVIKYKNDSANKHRSSVEGYLRSGCLSRICSERHVFIEDNLDDSTKAALQEIAKEQPVYQVLRSVATSSDTQLVPLSLAERMIRESQAEAEVRKKYNLSPDDSISSSAQYNAHIELEQRRYQIDEEVTPRRRSGKDSQQRLLDFVIDTFNHYGKMTDDPIAGLYYDGEMMCLTRNGVVEEIGDHTSDWSKEFSDELGGVAVIRDIEECIYSSDLLNRVAWLLIDDECRDLNGVELLNKAANESNMVELVFRRSMFGNLTLDTKVAPELLAYLWQVDVPCREFEGHQVRYPWSKKGVNELFPEVIDAESLAHLKRQIIGRAKESDPFRMANHMVMTGSRLKEYPEFTDSYDLRLHLPEQNMSFIGGGQDILNIPGYELVAYNRGHWYYEQAEADPYLGSQEVIIEDDHRGILKQKCQDIGFTQLAAALDRPNDLSLADLVAAIRDSSRYTFDPSCSLIFHEGKVEDNDFATLIDPEGFLQVQCTGASAFLCHALKAMFPESTAVPITGNKINLNGEISLVGHAQVLFSYNGKQYILDATPPAYLDTSSTFGSNPNAAYSQSHMRQQNSNYNKDSEVHSDKDQESAGETTTLAKKIHQEQHEKGSRNVTERTKILLKAHFKLPPQVSDEILYKNVVALKKDADPIRRVVELMLAVENGDDNVYNQIEQSKSYLELVKSADRAALRRIGIPRYNKSLLQALSKILDDLKIKAQEDSVQ